MSEGQLNTVQSVRLDNVKRRDARSRLMVKQNEHGTGLFSGVSRTQVVITVWVEFSKACVARAVRTANLRMPRGKSKGGPTFIVFHDRSIVEDLSIPCNVKTARKLTTRKDRPQRYTSSSPPAPSYPIDTSTKTLVYFQCLSASSSCYCHLPSCLQTTP